MTTQRRIIRESRFSFTGSARHVWRITRHFKLVTVPLALVLIPAVWAALVALNTGLFLFGLLPALLVYRFTRRAVVEVAVAAQEQGSAPAS